MTMIPLVYLIRMPSYGDYCTLVYSPCRLERFREVRQSSLLCHHHRAPPRSVGRKPGGLRGLAYLEHGFSVLARQLMEWECRRDMQNPLAADQGEIFFPVQFLYVWQGKMYPACPFVV
jgi:hypothetical protein